LVQNEDEVTKFKEERREQLDMNDSARLTSIPTSSLVLSFDVREVEVAVLCSALLDHSSRERVLLVGAFFEHENDIDVGVKRG
jgi:hypothetical protein